MPLGVGREIGVKMQPHARLQGRVSERTVSVSVQETDVPKYKIEATGDAG